MQILRTAALALALSSTLLVPAVASAAGEEARDATAPEGSVYRAHGRLGDVRLVPSFGFGLPEGMRASALVKASGLLSAGGAYAVLPSFPVPGVGAQVARTSAEGFLRVHPLRNAFYVGLAGGFVDADVSIVRGDGVALARTHAAFVAPHVGFQWMLSMGLTIGLDAGVEIPLGANRSDVDAEKSGRPISGDARGRIASSMDVLTSKPMPVVRLLELGFAL